MNQSFLLIMAAALHSTLATLGGSHATMHVCNRGLCYNKKEDLSRGSPSLKQKKRGGVDVCTDAECELYAILGTEIIEEGEAVACLDCPSQPNEQPNDTHTELNVDFEILDDIDLDKRRSWREEPKRGSCYDDDLGYLFDCNLVKILDDGLILIEDLRSGGAFAAEPSTFHLNKNEKKKQQMVPRLPNVVVTGEDPSLDFRTIVELNMMGI